MKKIVLLSLIFILLVLQLKAHPPWGIAVDKNKNIYFADIFHNGRGTVWKLTNEGKLIALFKDFHSHNVSLDKDGNLYTAHGEGNHRLVKVSANGKNTETLINEPNDTKFYGGNTTVSPNGNIYFGTRKYIWKYQKKGNPIKFNPHKLEWNQTVFVDEEENIYVPDKAVGGGSVFKLTTDGKAEKIAENLISKLDRPADKHNDVLLGIGKDKNGFIYIGETAGRRIIKISKDGKAETFYTSEENYLPTGITFFEDEAYILEFSNNFVNNAGPQVVKIDKNGKKTTIFNYSKYKEPVANKLSVSTNSQNEFTLNWMYFLIIPALLLLVAFSWKRYRKN